MRLNQGSWIKVFADKTTEQGHDYLIDQKKASWTQGRQDNIKEVFLSEGLIAVTLEVPETVWYQYDRYSVILSENPYPKRIARFIQAQISKRHIGQYLCYNNKDIHLVWATVKPKMVGDRYKIISTDINKWITAEISSSKVKLFIGEKSSRNGKQVFN